MNNLITILFLSANPANTQELELIKECNEIEEELQFAAGKGKFKLEQHHDISILNLIKVILNKNPQIVHFSGHGSPRSALILKNEKGEVEVVPSDALSKLFEVLSKDISLVFLNACYSEEQAKAISKNVNCVIGMSRAISDKAARKFAVRFYSSIGFGKSVGDAFKLASIELELESIPEESTPRISIKEGLDPSKLNFNNGNQPLAGSICEQLDTFSQFNEKLNMGEVSIEEFFKFIYTPIRQFTSNPENKIKFGELKIKSVDRLLINLSTTIQLIRDRDVVGDSQSVSVKTNEAKGVAQDIVKRLYEMCANSH